MAELAELRAEVSGILTELNQAVTALTTVRVRFEEIGDRIFALRTHNADAMTAAGISRNEAPDELERLVRRLSLAILSLENYERAL